MSPSVISEIFKAQTEFQKEASLSTASQRRDWLKRLRLSILDHEESLKTALWQDFGKHALEVEISELMPCLLEIDHCLKELSRWMAAKKVPTPFFLQPASSFIVPQAKGRVLILSPWNYPFNLCLSPLVLALAAGNTVMLKPSEKTPQTSALIQKIIKDVFPERHIAVILGEASTAEALTRLPFDHIFFTGSTRVGQKVMRAASENLTPVTLELGGKSPVIVDTDADLELTAQVLVWGKFINAGQTCIAPDYVLVPQDRRAEFFEQIQKSSKNLQMDEMAKIIDENSFQRLLQIFEKSKNSGDEIVCGGEIKTLDRKISVTFVECQPEAPWNSPWMEEEIFGPILPVIFYKNMDEILEKMQSLAKPLALYYFGHHQAQRLQKETHSGAYVVNNVAVHFANPHLPFGGIGASGMGASHGETGFRAFSHLKPVMRQGPFAPGSIFYPPYQQKGTAWGRKFLQLLRRS